MVVKERSAADERCRGVDVSNRYERDPPIPDVAGTLGLAIGELGRLIGTKVETIRYYERIGLLVRQSEQQEITGLMARSM